jgi:hypothetical protein
MLMDATANRPRQRPQIAVLVVLIAALAAVVAVQVLPLLGDSNPPPPAPAPVAVPPAAHPPATTAPVGRRATPPRSTARDAAPRASAHPAGVDAGVEEVHLEKLKQPEPEPIEGRRNPFSLAPEPKSPAAASNYNTGAGPGGPASQVPSAPPIAQGPPPVPPPPPITLKFFGVVSGPGRVGRVAALGDGKFVYHGREGSIIEGRYRIVKIGEESIQLEYADGRGRQTIRLSGK